MDSVFRPMCLKYLHTGLSDSKISLKFIANDIIKANPANLEL